MGSNQGQKTQFTTYQGDLLPDEFSLLKLDSRLQQNKKPIKNVGK